MAVENMLVFGADPKSTLKSQKGTVSFGKGLARTLLRYTEVQRRLLIGHVTFVLIPVSCVIVC